MVKINEREYLGIVEENGRYFTSINICNTFYPDFIPYILLQNNTVELRYNEEVI